MYSVYARKGNQTVCIYNDVYRTPDTMSLEPKLELTESCAGSFKIKLVDGNNGYSFIERLNTEIIIKKEDVEIWSGRVISEETDFWKNRVIECEGELAYLNDTTQPQAEFHDITPRSLLQAFIQVHNEHAPSDKQFTVGIVTVTDPNDSLYRYTNYESTLEAINEKLVKRLGGYLHVRKESGVRYLDYLAEHPDTNTQPIEFGTNLLDFTKTFESTDFCTVVLPLGERQEDSEIEALEAYLTVESVNQGSPYVVNQNGVDTFGWICKVVHWDNVTTASALLSKAQDYLSEVQFDTMVLEVQAVDMHYTDRDIEDIELSDKIRVISAPHGLDRYFPLTKMSIPLDKPEDTAFTLGDDIKVSLSTRSNDESTAVKERIDALPTKQSILDDAFENSREIVESFTNGYITITQNDNGSEELYISDYQGTSGEDIRQHASRYWRWNLNGLAYYRNQSNLGLALTMDGAINADKITVGTLNADRIRAGVLQNTEWSPEGNSNAVKIKFSADSETESSYDYIYIYVYDTTNNVYRRTDKITGSLANLEVTIPDFDFWIYWYTDSSVVKNGWQIVSITRTTVSESSKYSNFPTSVSSLPTANTRIRLDGVSTLPESDHPYTSNERVLWTWYTKLKPNNVFYLDLVNGVLKMNASELTIAGESVSSVAIDGMNQSDVFNKLTNNGSIQGLYMQNNQLYVNASYIQSGTLKLGGYNNGNGILECYTSGNAKYLEINMDEITLGRDDGNEKLIIQNAFLYGKSKRENNTWEEVSCLDMESYYGTRKQDIHAALKGKYKLHLQSDREIALEIGTGVVKAYADSDGFHAGGATIERIYDRDAVVRFEMYDKYSGDHLGSYGIVVKDGIIQWPS